MWTWSLAPKLCSCLLAGVLLGGAMSDSYPSVPPPGDDTSFWCRPANPTCAPSRWATEWNETGTSDLVRYEFIEPGLVSEDRFVEAIWLIWQWPEGKDLLRSAAEQGVLIASDPNSSPWEFGHYSPLRRRLVVNQTYAGAFTWMLGTVLVHELRHAADLPDGDPEEETEADCVRLEERAFDEETRYLSWVGDRFSGLPKPGDLIAGHLTPENVALYNDVVEQRATPDLSAMVRERYQQQCGRLSQSGG